MKFDVVVGNPPYNNDLYLDFVQTGYNLLKADGVMVQITPAKWQAKGGKKNEDFRANIVPHMKEIVYFEDAKQVFDIALTGGICYYSVENGKKFDKKLVCGNETTFDIDIPLLLYKTGQTTLLNKIKEQSALGFIVKDDNILPCFDFGTGLDFTSDHYRADGFIKESKYYICDTGKKLPMNPAYVRNIEIFESNYTLSVGKYGGRGIIFAPYEIPRHTFTTLFYGTENECKYAKSYYDSKLVQFIIELTKGSGGVSRRSFRFVPDPGQFDHIFTDAELYKKYNLTQDEINIIESVIKERK